MYKANNRSWEMGIIFLSFSFSIRSDKRRFNPSGFPTVLTIVSDLDTRLLDNTNSD